MRRMSGGRTRPRPASAGPPRREAAQTRDLHEQPGRRFRSPRRPSGTLHGPYAQQVSELRKFHEVELSALDLLTSCMPSPGSTSTRVHPRRSPSLSVHPQPSKSPHVAVLSCCIFRQVHSRPETLRYSPHAPCSHGLRHLAAGSLRLLTHFGSYSSADERMGHSVSIRSHI